MSEVRETEPCYVGTLTTTPQLGSKLFQTRRYERDSQISFQTPRTLLREFYHCGFGKHLAGSVHCPPFRDSSCLRPLLKRKVMSGCKITALLSKQAHFVKIYIMDLSISESHAMCFT